MATSARCEKRALPSRTNTVLIGSFFEAGLAHLLNCQLSEYGKPELADIYNPDLGFRVEVKARDHGHAFGLKVSQKNKYLKNNLPFPDSFEHTLYALATYRRSLEWVSKKFGPRGRSENYISRLLRLESEHEKCELLASTWMSVYLIDIQIINALQEVFGVSRSRHLGQRDEHDIVIRQGRDPMLPQLFCRQNFTKTLEMAGLKARDWRGFEREVKSHFKFSTRDNQGEWQEQSYSTHFRLVAVTQKDLSRNLLNMTFASR